MFIVDNLREQKLFTGWMVPIICGLHVLQNGMYQDTAIRFHFV